MYRWSWPFDLVYLSHLKRELIVVIALQAGNYVKDEVWHGLIVVITNASNLHGYTVRALYKAVQVAGEQVLQQQCDQSEI